MTNYSRFFSSNALAMHESEIRELLKITARPGIISFAGGLPAPDMFPYEEIERITGEVLRKDGGNILQYGPTEGLTGLREELLKFLEKENIHLTMKQLFVVASSQQGLDLLGKVFIDPGDTIISGKPTYVGAIQAFHSYRADICPVKLYEDGMDIEELENRIKELLREGRKPKFIYLIPDFQNPSGITVSLEKRKRIIDIAERYDLIIVEDSPYRQLRFEGEPVPPMISLNSERVIALYTFSKILCPGFRLGWMAGPEELIQKIIVAKQATDLCTSGFTQAIAMEYMKRGLLQKQIEKIIAAYRVKRDFMVRQLEEYLPSIEGIRWTRPEGGLFLWVTLPEYMDTAEMFKKAVTEKNVAYITGRSFDPEGKEKNSMRLNFSYATQEQIREGIQRLADLVKDMV